MGPAIKNQALAKRFANACNGIACAFSSESSFRTEVVLGIGTLGTTLWLHPQGIWVALIVIMIALVLAAELINTALEHTLDGLHPETAGFVKLAKDCAAAAVLVLSLAAVLVFVLMLGNVFTGMK